MLVFVTRGLSGTNGADQVAIEILSALVATGEPVAVILEEDASRCPQTAEIAAQWVPAPAQVRFPANVGPHWPRRFASWVKWSILDVPRRLRLRRLTPRLVLVNGFGNHDFWMRLPLPHGGLPALIVHESPRHFGGEHQARSLEWAFGAMDNYQHFIFVSEHCQREWNRYPIVARRGTSAIPNCCREDAVARALREERSSVRKRLGFGTKEFVAVCVSTVQYRKGQDLLVECLPQLFRRVSGIRLELVGNTINSTDWVLGSRDFKAVLMRRLEELRLGDRVRFWGPRDDALDFIHAADVLLLPSRAEGMPLAVLEAMALGTPVVASSVDGVTELIEDGSTGLLFDPAQPADLIEAVDRIARDPDFACGLAKRGQERYWQEFNAKKLREGYLTVVTEIGAASKSARLLDSPHNHSMDTVLAGGRDRVTADTVRDG